MSTSSDGPREAAAHQREQRVPAGEHLGVVVASEQLDRLVDASRPARTSKAAGITRPPSPPPATARDDVVVAGAAAEVALEPVADLLLGRVRVLLQQRDRRHDEARRAEAALQRVLLVERLLHRVQLAVRGEALDRRHLAAVGLHGEHRARLHRLAVEQHRARAAGGRVAADVRPLEPERARAGSTRAAAAARRPPRAARR